VDCVRRTSVRSADIRVREFLLLGPRGQECPRSLKPVHVRREAAATACLLVFRIQTAKGKRRNCAAGKISDQVDP